MSSPTPNTHFTTKHAANIATIATIATIAATAANVQHAPVSLRSPIACVGPGKATVMVSALCRCRCHCESARVITCDFSSRSREGSAEPSSDRSVLGPSSPVDFNSGNGLFWGGGWRLFTGIREKTAREFSRIMHFTYICVSGSVPSNAYKLLLGNQNPNEARSL